MLFNIVDRDSELSDLRGPREELEDRRGEFERDGNGNLSVAATVTEIFGTNSEFPPIGMESMRLRIVPELGISVREISDSLRAEIHQFIHANIRPPSGFGFLAEMRESPSLAPLVRACREASDKLEEIFLDRSSGDLSAIQVRGAAHRVQTGLEEFLVCITGSDPSEVVSESDLGNVLRQCIGFKGFLANNLQQLDLLNLEYRAAAQNNVEAMQGEQSQARRLSRG